MRKLFRLLIIVLSVFIVVFLAAAIIVPYVYRDKIPMVVKTALDDNLDATTEIGAINLSLFQHFPHLSVRIHEIRITGKETFRKDTLLKAKEIDLSLDLLKALKGQYDILNITLNSPHICAIVNRKGVANWNIVRPSKDTVASKPKAFSLKLRKYEIIHGDINYTDEQKQMHLAIAGLNHKGSGNFDEERFKLKTNTEITSLTFVNGKIPYCSGLKVKLDLEFDMDQKAQKISFDTHDIMLNGMNLQTKGFVQFKPKNELVTDIEFSTPSNDFKDMLSLVPGIYEESFKDVKTTGEATFSGEIKGTYSDQSMPAFKVMAEVKGGSIQYPGLPQKVDQIHFKFRAGNPDGIPDHTVVTIENGHCTFGAEPLDFALQMHSPVTQQYVEINAKGRLDLSHISDFIKLDQSTHLTGKIVLDVAAKGSVLAAENAAYDSLDAKGELSIDSFSYSAKDLPATAFLNSLKVQFTPSTVVVSNLDARMLDTHITGSGNVNNVLGYYLHKGILSGSIAISADMIDGNKWQKDFTKPKPKKGAAPDTAKAAEQAFVAPSGFNIELNASVDEIEYDHVKIKNVRGTMLVGDGRIDLKEVQAHALDGEVTINGYYSSQNSKTKPDLDFDYLVSLGRLTVVHRHIYKL